MNTRLLLVTVFLMALLVTSGTAQVTGDYRSVVNNGQWDTLSTWERYDGANWVAAASAPGATNNVTIRNGFNVLLSSSGKNCANLTIEAGATFKTGVALPTSGIRYVRINGATATINGIFGDSAGIGDAISLEAAGNNNTVTITGTGAFAPARVRVNSSASGCTIIFDMDAKFMYTGSSGSGGIALYPQSDNNTFTVNAGKTLTFVDQASVAVGSSNGSASSQSVTFNVHGTMDLSRPGSQLTLKASGGKTATMNIFSGGSVTVGNKMFASTVGDGGTTVLVVDGSLTTSNQVDFSNPAFVVTGTGTFTLSTGGTLLVGHPQGITSSGATGQIQTTTRNFNPGTNYNYVGTAAQVTGDALPPTVYQLTINDSLGVTLSQTTAVNGKLTLTRGALRTGTKTLMMMDTGWVFQTSGFVEGNLQKRILTGTNVNARFEVGTGTTFSPVDVYFGSVSSEGTMTVTAKAGKHPRIGNAVDPWHALNRYWTLTMGGIAFDFYNATFGFAAADKDPGADTAVFVVARENAGVWSYPQTADRLGSSIAAWTMTQAGDFVVGNPLPASMLVPSNGTGGGVWDDLLTWKWGAVPRHSDSAGVVTGDSVFVEAPDSCNTVGVQTGGKLVLDSTLAVVNMGAEGTVLKNQTGGLTATGIVAFGDGGYYIHNQAGGSIPTALWGIGSTCEIRAVLSAAPSNGNQNFYNVVWNCPNQSANLNLGWNRNTIGGTITVLATGSGSRWQMMAPQVDSTTTTTVMGDVIVQGGQFSTNGTGSANSTVIVHHYGNIMVTAGNFSISRGSQGGSGTTRWYLHQGNFSMANATTQNSNANGARFVFQKPGTQTLTLSSVTFSGGMPIQVDSGTTLSTGTSVIRGSGSFTLNNGATLATANAGGLDSTLQMAGVKTLTGASFVFNGSHPQITGASLPAEVAGVTVDNDSSVTLSRSVTVDSTLSVLHGHLFLNGDTVTLGSAGLLHETPGNTVAGDSGVIMTTRTLDAPSATVDIAGLGVKIGSSANLASTVITRGHAAQNAGEVSVKRYFEITPTTNTGLNASLEFLYDASELNGTSASALQLFRSDDAGAHWTEVPGVANDTLHSVKVTGLASLSRWTAAEPPVPAPAQVLLITPLDNAIIHPDSVVCVWQKSSPAVTAYWFEVGNDSIFTTSKIDSTITDTTAKAGSLQLGHVYWWRVRAKNVSGWGPFSTSRKFRADFIPSVGEGMEVPLVFSLKQNYPNPFNPSTTILYTVEKAGRATMELYNILGQRVQTLFDGVVEPGRMHMVKFDGGHLPSGTYFYRLQSEGKTEMKKLLLLK